MASVPTAPLAYAGPNATSVPLVVAPSPLLVLPGMGEELTRVEAALRASVVSEDPHLTELASHLIQAGGKRLRPALTIATAACRTGFPVAEEAVLGGVAV